MSRWFRFYEGALDDPKVQRLAPALFKAWVNLLCLAARNNGVIPPPEDVSFALRLSKKASAQLVDDLCSAGLIDEFDGKFRPHNWDERQFKSDKTDTTAADRMRRHRNAHRNAHRNGTVTVTATRADTEQSRTEQSRADAQDAPPAKASRRKPAGRISDDWKPLPSGVTYAKGLGLLDSDLRKEIERFKNHARQNDRVASNWDMAWRNWCIKAAEFLGRSPPPAPGDTVVPQHGDVLADGQVYLRADTHEYDAWADYYRKAGQKHPPRYFHGGWKFPSRWPPGAIRSAVCDEAAE